VNAYIEPKHNMAVTLTFLRSREYNCCGVSFTINAQGSDRIASIFDTNTNTWQDKDEISNYDFEAMALPTYIYGDWNITSWWEEGTHEDLTSQFSDFIIKPEKPLASN
jgi:hypothetical protein